MPKKHVDVDARAVTILFEDDRTVVINLDDLSDDMVRRAALHGLSQKLGDSYAGAKTATEDGADPVSWSFEQADDMATRIKAGEWAAPRAAGTGTASAPSILAEAVAMATGKDVADVIKVLADATKEQKTALRKNPAVAKAIAEVKAKREAAKAAKLGEQDTGPVDLGSLLS